MKLPAGAIQQHVAIVGKTGSGKTFAAKGIVEDLLAGGERCCIIDPTGAWWGLRASADGKKDGFPVVVFGGDHADVQIAEGSGGPLGKVIAYHPFSCVIDLSGFGVGEARRFMTAFLGELYQHVKSPLHLIVDEADEFAPQRIPPDGTTLFNRIDRIVRRGRSRGFRVMMISQRPAVLNKDVLSQVATLIAMKLTAPQDRAALGTWIEGQADKVEGKAIVDGLSKLKIGEGWVWWPEGELLEKTTFPRIRTFDSSRTPGPGERVSTPQHMAAIDLAGIRASLVTAEEERKANDPAELKKQIAELQRQIRQTSKGGPIIDQAAVEEAYRKGAASEKARADRAISVIGGHLIQAIKAQQHVANAERLVVEWLQQEVQKPAASDPLPIYGARNLPSPAAMRPKLATGAGDTKLGSPERKILIALAQHGESDKHRLAILTGYSHNGGAFNNPLGKLRTAGYVEKGWPTRITDDGMKALGDFDPLPSGQALIDYWLGSLGTPQQKILVPLIEAYPGGMDKESLAAAAGYEPGGGAFNNPLGNLRTLGLVDKGWPAKASRNLMEGR